MVKRAKPRSGGCLELPAALRRPSRWPRVVFRAAAVPGVATAAE